jgi:hypothetical protein
MLKLIIGLYCLAILLSGCANQQLQTAQSIWAPMSVKVPATKTPTEVLPPIPQKQEKKRVVQKKKRIVIADTQPRKSVNKRPVLPIKNPAAVAKPKQELVSLSGTKSSCPGPTPKLPEDADRRSATASVQCFFISRGEYLTNTGAVKPLP